jgi:hypothetical protein
LTMSMTPSERFTLTRRQLGALISRLDRSRAGRASTGSFLENLSKLLQVLAIVVGGAWVLIDYFEFKNTNNQLTNTQLELANKTAELNQTSMILNNQFSQLKLASATEGRLETATESSVLRSAKFTDGTFLYQFKCGLRIKNISDSKVVLPAMVIEFFIGTSPVAGLKTGQAFLTNVPSSWLDKAIPGSIEWSRLTANVQRIPYKFDEEVEKRITEFPRTVGGLVGEIPPGGLRHWNADFVLRARPENMAGAVITFWARGEKEPFGRPYTYTRIKMLSDAEDAPSLRAQEPHIPRDTEQNVQRPDSPALGSKPN